jgi:hypothetical protein
MTAKTDQNMLKISQLNLGFSDAENYKRRENKNYFNNIFLRDDSLDRLCEDRTFFLIGEKGTGKTAYAVYLSNNNYKNNFASIKYIRETEYQKFVALKRERHLQLSDYANIWKTIIYLLIAEQVSEREKGVLSRFTKFRDLKKAINEYYAHAFSPEIIYAISLIEDSKRVAELMAKYAKLGGEQSSHISFSETRFQTNLMYIQKMFEEAFKSLNLSHNHIIFIDGIDIRPSPIDYNEYLECVKGLANAIWSMNNDFFSSIKDSKGRLRVVLLMRPDIFNSLGLQNQNNKIRDNSVLLDWRTTYSSYRNSAIFMMADKLLSSQQEIRLRKGEAWDYYFPYNTTSVKETHDNPTSFIQFLRYSLYRPRDIVTMLTILKENFIEQNKNPSLVFSEKDFNHADFKRKLSEYLLGEVKDQMSFYYSFSDYEVFLKFFEFLNGTYKFTYEEYIEAYLDLSRFISENEMEKPAFCETADKFLQFLYDLNILCYVEDAGDEILFRWSFRERDYSNISPKVKTHKRYEIHYGFSKALNLGKRVF